MVQRQAARWVKQDYRLTISVSDMIEDLQWLTLCERKKHSRLTTFYKFYIKTLQTSISQNITYPTLCRTLHVYLNISK